jgi:hypothetical protein
MNEHIEKMGDHPFRKILAKSGYRSDMKYIILNQPFIFMATHSLTGNQRYKSGNLYYFWFLTCDD